MINKLTKTTEFFDYVPVISTFKSLADLFTNYVILPKKTQIEIYQHHYYRLVDAKSVKRMLMLTVPVIGNIVVALYDLTHQKLNHQAAVLYEIKNSNFELVNEELKADKAFMLKAIRSNYNAYDLVCKELKYEVDIFRTALAHTSDILLTLPDELKKFKKFIELVFDNDFSCLANASEELQKDKQIFSTILEIQGFSLKHAHADLIRDKEIVKIAALNDLNALIFANCKLREDADFIKPGFKKLAHH